MPEPPASDDFARALASALRQSASIARALEGRVSNRPKAGEATPVKAALTIADTASQEALLVALLEHFPGVRIEAEEDTPSVHRFPDEGNALVVVDPIDGTLRFYLEGRGPYAVMIGLAVDDVYQAALVALPREELYLQAVRGGGARVARGEGAPEVARVEASGRNVYVSHDLPEPAAEVLRASGLELVPASGGAIAVAPLVPGVRAGLRLVRGASPGVSTRGRIGALVSEEAGALVRCETGDAFPGRIRDPAHALLVAADEADLDILQRAVAALDAG
jgi:hypothetical protein